MLEKCPTLPISQIAPRVTDRLPPFFFTDFLSRMSRMHGGQITFLLDEADPLLSWGRLESTFFPIIRASLNAGNCRYIVSGYQTWMDEIHDSTSPFYLGFDPLILRPFERKDTAEIVLEPMKSMRIRLEHEQDLIERIYVDTRGHPYLIQYYCVELIRQMKLRAASCAVSRACASRQNSSSC